MLDELNQIYLSLCNRGASLVLLYLKRGPQQPYITYYIHPAFSDSKVVISESMYKYLYNSEYNRDLLYSSTISNLIVKERSKKLGRVC